MHRIVYKVCSATDWQAASASGIFVGSADDLKDGFIHLSTAEQLAGTLTRHFAGRADLVLVAIDAASIGKQLRWEPSRGGQLFPHLYTPLDPALAISVQPLPLAADGCHVLPRDLDKGARAC